MVHIDSLISNISTVLGNPIFYGLVKIDKNYPVVGETVTATFEPFNVSSFPDPIGTPSWLWYKTQEKDDLSSITNKTQIGTGDTYTLKTTDVGYWIWAEVSYSGNSGTIFGRTGSTVIGIPATATVSVSVEALRILNPSLTTLILGDHRVKITLTLSDGKWNDVPYSTASQWLTITGTPSISSWSNSRVTAQGRELVVSYQANSDTTLPISNLTASLNTAQLSTMRTYTNVTSTLTTGTPATASVSQWTISNI